MATKFDRFLSSGGNFASRFGPAQGVDYFSAGRMPVSGPSNLIEEGALEQVERPVQPEAFRPSGGDRAEPTGPTRDISKDPLSATEARALGVIQGGISLLGGLPGAGINQAIDYNLGMMNSNQKATDTEVGGLTHRDSLGYLGGIARGVGMTPEDAAKWAGEQRALDLKNGVADFFGIGRNPADVAVSDVNDTMGYGPVGLEAMMDQDQQWSMGPPASTTTGGDTPSAPSGGYDGGSYAGGDFGYSGEGRGDYFADGGMVGLSEPMFGGQAPRTLAQMGFADGGGVGMATPQGGNSAEMVNMRVNEMMRNPQVQQMVQQVVGAAMQSGELTPEELVTLGRIAEASIHNPALYPKLRQFAIQQGMAPLPPAFDQRVIMVLMVASRMMGGAGAPVGATPPGQVPPTSQAQMQNPNGQPDGGFLQGPGTGRSDSIGTQNLSTGGPVKVSNGEYVIPAHVVAAKGKDFFDKMLRQYAPLTSEA